MLNKHNIDISRTVFSLFVAIKCIGACHQADAELEHLLVKMICCSKDIHLSGH